MSRPSSELESPPDAVRLLLVDDRPANLAAMSAVLGGEGIELVQAASGNDALRCTLRQDFALVLLDVQMPGMDGFETAELMRANPRTRHVPIIFVTAGMRDTKLLFKGYDLGAVDYLIKPFEPHILKSKARVFCDLYRQRRQLESNQLLLESRIRERVSQLREAQRIANIGSWEYDVAAGETQWSDQMYVIFGEARDSFAPSYREFIGRVHPDDRARTEAVMRDTFARGTGYELEYRVVTPAGKILFVLAQAEMIRDAGGRPRRVVGTVLDITARKTAENGLVAAKAEAERANNAKSRFLAAASHDLRQPLSALNLYIDVLQNKVAAADRPLVRNMKDCAGSLSELLTDLLDLSKLDAGVVTPNVCDFPIADLTANLTSVYAPEAALKGLRLGCRSSGLAARTDPVLFQRMLGNLLSNALRYTERGGVLIACRRRRGVTWVEVWDTGIGIAEDRIAEIFEEFRQLGDDARNRGSGLGLAIVAKSAALLGLRVRVRSRPGRGSMFAVELPPGTTARRLAGARVKARALRIALVEDNPRVRQALVYALSGNGHELVAAGTGQELQTELAGRAPDIVISDYRLADGETGFDVIASVRAAFGDALPALLITGDTDPKLMRGMATRGIVVQHKPLDIEALQACIAGLMNDDAVTQRPTAASA
jgi:PAS domain S-box-containing protein